jgi:hypothetical protein
MLLDLPHVVEGTKRMLCDMGVDHRCELVSGDFFEDVPSGADAYYLQHIIHDAYQFSKRNADKVGLELKVRRPPGGCPCDTSTLPISLTLRRERICPLTPR